MRDLPYTRREQIIFNEHRFRPYEFPKTAKEVELYSVKRETILALLNAYPRANKMMRDYAIK